MRDRGTSLRQVAAAGRRGGDGSPVRLARFRCVSQDGGGGGGLRSRASKPPPCRPLSRGSIADECVPGLLLVARLVRRRSPGVTAAATEAAAAAAAGRRIRRRWVLQKRAPNGLMPRPGLYRSGRDKSGLPKQTHLMRTRSMRINTHSTFFVSQFECCSFVLSNDSD